MKKLELNPTETTPMVTVLDNGLIRIIGRCYPEDSVSFFEQVRGQVCLLEGDIYVDVYLNYINTSSSKLLYEMLKELDQREKDISNITVNWYYEEDDEDIKELGQIYQESLYRVKFNYHELIDA